MPDTEIIGTSTIKLAIATSEYLKEYISEGDKGPSLDGYICGFTKKGYLKKNELGRAPVQVKGKSTKAHSDLNREKYSYPVDVDDLHCFKREGGAIFFLVLFFEKDANQKKIFYAKFLPYDINELLMGKEHQNTISVSLKPFPSGAEMDDAILNFIDNRNKQSSIINAENTTIDQLFKNNVSVAPLTFSLGYTSTQHQKTGKPFQFFFDHDFYMYQDLGKGMLVPAQHISRLEAVATEYDVDISIGKGHYFNHCQQIYHKDSTEYVFYNTCLLDENKQAVSKYDLSDIGFTAVIEDKTDDTGKSKGTYSFKLKGNLQERINIERFILALHVEKGFWLNGRRIDLPVDGQELQKLDRKYLEENLKYLEEVQRTLDILGCKIPLEVDSITESDEEKIKALVLAILYDQPLQFNQDIPAYGLYELCNLHLIIRSQKQAGNSYKLHPLNWESMDCAIDGCEGLQPTSFYTLLTADDFKKISNLDYSTVAKSICSHDNAEHLQRANLTLLRLLSAYDDTNRESLLEAASIIASWLITKQVDDVAIAKINHYQCIKRKAQLSEGDKKTIMTLIDENHNRNDLLAGCYALLDNREMARHYLDMIDQEHSESFQLFPIMRYIL